ncbi:secretion protein HlyD [Ferrimonas sp. YFM]|nr:secretion protein HlyD [Ferrimonas sp. YFM]
MSGKLKPAIVAGVMVAALSGFYFYLAPQSGVEKTNNAYVQGEITQISAEVGGVVTRLNVDDNQWVEQGALLAELDNRDYLARRDQAKGALTEALAAVESARQQVQIQQNAVDQAATGIESAHTDAQLQKLEWQRQSELLGRNLTSASVHDAQKTRMELARLSEQSAELKLEGARQGLASARSGLKQLEAKAAQAQAALTLAELALEDTHIRAAVSGVVGNRGVRVGQLVAPGAPLLSIVPTDNLWVDANFKEGQLTQMLPDQPVTVVLDSFPEQPLNGRVESVSPATGAQFSLLPPDNATGNFVKVVQRVPVKIVLDLPQELKGRIVPGLSAVVEVDTRGQG